MEVIEGEEFIKDDILDDKILKSINPIVIEFYAL